MEKDYIDWIEYLKHKIRSAQLKASVAVNTELLLLYWDIGKSIVDKQENFGWGSKVVEQMAKDLKRELPDSNGFSRTNLFAMRKFYSFYNQQDMMKSTGTALKATEVQDRNELVHQVGGQLSADSVLCQIPWRHHVAIMSKCSNLEEALFYIQQTKLNNWCRNVLEIQMESKLIERQGKAQNNFERTLPKPQGDLAKETLKDSYRFTFSELPKTIRQNMPTVEELENELKKL